MILVKNDFYSHECSTSLFFVFFFLNKKKINIGKKEKGIRRKKKKKQVTKIFLRTIGNWSNK